jgi:hypothetical protein
MGGADGKREALSRRRARRRAGDPVGEGFQKLAVEGPGVRR